MVDALWKPITVLLFDGTCYCNSCLYLFVFNCFLTKKRWAKWIATEGYFFRMSLEDLIRLWTSLEILTQTYQLGFYLNILLGILLIIKYFKVKQ